MPLKTLVKEQKKANSGVQSVVLTSLTLVFSVNGCTDLRYNDKALIVSDNNNRAKCGAYAR